MKVVLDDIIWTLQKWGGISVYWKELTSRLSKNEQIDISTIKLKRPKKLSFEDSGVKSPVIIEPKKKFLLPERYSNLDYDFNKKHIFHSSYYRVSKNSNAINVTTVHDFTYETHTSGLKKSVHVLQKRHALMASKGIICISEYSRDLMFKLYPFTKKKHVKVIYNGVSEVIKGHLKNDVQNELPFENQSYALYIGNRVAKYKNFDLCVEVVRRLNMPLVIVGGGDLNQNEILKLASVKFKQFPFVDEYLLCELYRGARFLLYPSLSEGFGIPIIEAQSLECPVVTTNKTCIPEISGNAAILVDKIDLDNLIEEIHKLDNQTYKMDLLLRGKLNSRKYSWNLNYEETMKFYQELLYNSFE